MKNVSELKHPTYFASSLPLEDAFEAVLVFVFVTRAEGAGSRLGLITKYVKIESSQTLLHYLLRTL